MLINRFLLIFLALYLLPLSVFCSDNNNDADDEWVTRMNELTALVPQNIDSVLSLGNEHLEECPFNDARKDGYYHALMAEVYYFKQELDLSLKAYQTSLAAFKGSEDSGRLAVLYNNIGLLHYLHAEFDSALVAYNHSLELELLANNKEGIAQSYQNLGIIYGKWERYSLVDEYYTNALRIYEELGNHSAIADVTNNIAVIAVRVNDIPKGLAYYKKAFDAYSKIDNEKGVATVASNLGRLFGKEYQLERAQHYFDVALEIFHRINYKLGLVHTYSMIGEMNIDIGEYDKAMLALGKASKHNESIGLREVQLGNLEVLYDAYKELGQFELANTTLEKSYALKDSIFNEEQFDKLIELEKKYHAEKSQKELAMMKAKEERSRLFMWGISILFLLLSTIVLIWVYVLKIKENKRQVDMEQKVLRTQMNPHFIFNSLSALQCIIMENNREDAVDFVADFSGLMRLVLQYAKEEHITLKKEKEILDRYMSLQNRRFDNKINYKIEFDEHIKMEEVLVPPMLTQPFIENAIEHGRLTQDGGYIHVRLQRYEDLLEFSIEDNGIGINNAIEDGKLHDKKHKSIALGLTRERLSLLNSKDNSANVTLKIEDLSKFGGRGTRVVFHVPYMTYN